MSLVKSAIVCGLFAVLLGGCGIAAKPLAGTRHLSKQPGFRGSSVALRPSRVECLKQHGFHVELFYTSTQHLPALRVGSSPAGPTMEFEPTAGYAEGLKITGQAQGAELIGPVLLYPNGASLSEAKAVEKCAAVGVS